MVYKDIDAAMQLLRTLHNSLAPISLLPPEVLARVFHFLSLEEPPFSGKQELGWIRATHVCQHWRQVALDDSSLWARISGMPTNIELLSEMLARARNAPLDIDIDLDGTPYPELILLMFPPHLSHTHKLSLHAATSLYLDSFRDIYIQEAPSLEHFELESDTSPIIFRELGGTTLFKGKAPRLRTLTLFQVFIPWALIPRGQLTQLEITLVDEISIKDFSWHGNLNQLIDLLVNCPELEVLILDACLPPLLTHFPCGQTIHLPHLSRLRLGGSSYRITNLLTMLKIPSSTTLQLYCTSENDLTYNDHFLLPVVSAHLQSSADAPPIEFKNLAVNLSCTGRLLEVTASTSLPIPQSQDLEKAVDEEEFVLSFDGLPVHGHGMDLIERVCEILPISNLEFLSISAPVRVDPLNWVELFRRCTKITTMQTIGRGTSGLVRALTSPKVKNTRRDWKWKRMRCDNRGRTLAQPAASHTPAPIFPKLTFLSLKRLDFAENEQPSGILFDIVQKGLRQRSVGHRSPLRMLCIDDCTISAKRANALQRLVQKFHWDEKRHFLEEHNFGDSDELLSWWKIFFDGG